MASAAVTPLLFVIRTSPYQHTLAREAIDALLGSAALGAAVKVLFSGDAVLHWLPDQAPPGGQKNLGAMLKALPLYDIDEVYVDRDALTTRGLTVDILPPGVSALDAAALRHLLSQPGQQLVSF